MNAIKQLNVVSQKSKALFTSRVSEAILDAARIAASRGNADVTLTVDELLGQIYRAEYPEERNWTDFWYRTARQAFSAIEDDIVELFETDGCTLTISDDLVVCVPEDASAVTQMSLDGSEDTLKQARVIYLEWWETEEDLDYALKGEGSDVPPALKHTV